MYSMRFIVNQILNRIDELRSQRGVSQNELARLLGVSANAVYHWRKTGALPTLANIEKICEVFGITVEQFFHGLDNEVPSSQDERFLNEWRSLSNEEKVAVVDVIKAFRAIKEAEQ